MAGKEHDNETAFIITEKICFWVIFIRIKLFVANCRDQTALHFILNIAVLLS